MKNIILILSISMAVLASCSSPKEDSLKQLRDFTNELEQESCNYTDDDWSEAADDFDIIVTDISNYSYTDEELNEIGRLQGKCTAIMTKKAAKDAKRLIEDLSKQAEGFLQGLSEEFSKADE